MGDLVPIELGMDVPVPIPFTTTSPAPCRTAPPTPERRPPYMGRKKPLVPIWIDTNAKVYSAQGRWARHNTDVTLLYHDRPPSHCGYLLPYDTDGVPPNQYDISPTEWPVTHVSDVLEGYAIPMDCRRWDVVPPIVARPRKPPRCVTPVQLA